MDLPLCLSASYEENGADTAVVGTTQVPLSGLHFSVVEGNNESSGAEGGSSFVLDLDFGKEASSRGECYKENVKSGERSERMARCVRGEMEATTNVLDDEDNTDSDVAGKGMKKIVRRLRSFI